MVNTVDELSTLRAVRGPQKATAVDEQRTIVLAAFATHSSLSTTGGLCHWIAVGMLSLSEFCHRSLFLQCWSPLSPT